MIVLLTVRVFVPTAAMLVSTRVVDWVMVLTIGAIAMVLVIKTVESSVSIAVSVHV